MGISDLELEDLRLEFDDGVVVLTLDRPEQLNAYSGPMGISLGHAYRACDEDDTPKAHVVGAVEDDAEEFFCSKGDARPRAQAREPAD